MAPQQSPDGTGTGDRIDPAFTERPDAARATLGGASRAAPTPRPHYTDLHLTTRHRS